MKDYTETFEQPAEEYKNKLVYVIDAYQPSFRRSGISPSSSPWSSYYEPFTRFGEMTSDIESMQDGNVSLVVLTGGADVDPALYGQEAIRETSIGGGNRDEYEAKAVRMAVSLGLPIFGICRGAQLLCALAGGKLVQHMEHPSRHTILTHTGESIEVNSLHHQMQFPPPTAKPLAWAYPPRSDVYLPGPAPDREYECVYYPNLKAVGVQYHPEMMSSSSRAFQYTVELAEKLITDPSSL